MPGDPGSFFATRNSLNIYPVSVILMLAATSAGYIQYPVGKKEGRKEEKEENDKGVEKKKSS